jgi:hypothetical protein
MSNNMSLFDGYEKSSTRYQTKRAEEVQSRDKNALKQLIEIENILKNSSSLSDEEIEKYEKRYRTLKKLFKVAKNKDYNQLFIPFYIDHRTRVFIREKNCFKDKWVKEFGKGFIKKRIQDYKKIIHLKPKNQIYWNPF